MINIDRLLMQYKCNPISKFLASEKLESSITNSVTNQSDTLYSIVIVRGRSAGK